MCVPAGCRNVSGCYSGFSWLWFHWNKKWSTSCRKIQTWEPQIPHLETNRGKKHDYEFQLNEFQSLFRFYFFFKCVNFSPIGLLGLNGGSWKSTGTFGDWEQDRFASGSTNSFSRLSTTEEEWKLMKTSYNFFSFCKNSN